MTSVLDRTVGFLANRLDRRGFLGKSAIVGSAIVAAPLDFGLRPTSAYAAVCSCSGSSCQCGSLCCDGYTEFCCTLNGQNACPPGTITAGWWKVDGSQFCGGAARYYLDCNAQCGGCGCGSNGVCAGSCSGTGCGCAKGSCGNRKAGCTRFRYGQCNQGVRCVGPIVCRVVTCAPPWQFDPACGTSSRTDNATRNHDRPCLQEPQGRLDSAVDNGSSGVRVRGWAVDSNDYGQSTVQVYVDNQLRWENLANLSRPDVAAAYPAYGPNRGFDVQIGTAPGPRMVCVYALDRSNGRRTLLGFQEVNVAGPDGRIDKMTDLGNGQVRLEGWALDPTRPGRPPNVRLRVDNQVVEIQASIDRPDVVRARPGATLRCGWTHVLTLSTGQRKVCADVRTSDARWHQFRCRTGLLERVPVGRLDAATDLGGRRVRVVGWAIDPPLQTGAATINIRVGNQIVATLQANRSRPDVAEVYPGYGPNHGFDVTIDAPTGGALQICVEAVSNGTITPLRCRSVQVAG